jgi:hypothetical protein
VPNIIKDASKALDPTAREMNTVGDYFKSSIPGVRNTLTERRDVLGRVVPQEPTGVAAFVDLFNSKTPRTNAIVDELGRLQQAGFSATPGKITKNQTIQGTKTELTPAELNRFEDQVGVLANNELTKLIFSDAYQGMDDDTKQSAIQKVMTTVRKDVRESGISSKTTDKKTELDVFYLRDESGKLSVIDISKEIEEPQYTGNEAIDKKLKSQYKSKITKRGNDIIKLFEAGQIDLDQATAMMDDLETQYGKSTTAKAKRPKSITVRSVSVKLPQLSKGTRTTPPRLTLPKLPTVRIKAGGLKPRSIAVKVKNPRKITVRGFRNTLGARNRLA